MHSIDQQGELLHRAIQANNVVLCKDIILATPEVLRVPRHNLLPITKATQMGRVEILDFILSLDAMLNDGGNSPIFAACKGGQPETAALLLSKGADPNIRDSKGATPLIYLCSYSSNYDRRPDLFDLLVQHGADLNLVTIPEGASALMRACMFGNLELAVSLLSRGADAKTHTKDNRNLLHYLAKRNVSSNDNNDNNNYTNFNYYNYYNSNNNYDKTFNQIKSILDMTLKQGVEITFIDKFGNSHMQLYLHPGDITTVARYYASTIQHYNRPPIFNIIQAAHITKYYSIIDIVLAIYPGSKYTILSVAAKFGSPQVIGWLLEHKRETISINGFHENHTALSNACKSGSVETSALLLDAGADPDLRYSINDMSPLHKLAYSCDVHKANIVMTKILPYKPLLDQRGTRKCYTALHLAIIRRNENVVRNLIKAGASLWDVVLERDNKIEYVSVWRMDTFQVMWKYLAINHSPKTHHRFPAYIRDAVKCFFMANKRLNWGLDNAIMHRILSYVAIDYFIPPSVLDNSDESVREMMQRDYSEHNLRRTNKIVKQDWL